MMFYLSGRITSNDPEEQRANLQKFHDLEKELVARGFEVFNPAKLETPGMTWSEYLYRDLTWIYQNRPILYQMDGWETSRGARIELEFSRALGLSVISSL